MVPVNLRTEADADGGNVVSAMLASLATNLDDPGDRLRTIHELMNAKKTAGTASARVAMAMGMGLLTPADFSGVPGVGADTPPPFNICVSNVPGMREPLYCKGARLDVNYPLSIAVDGMALNITLATSADRLDFGPVVCRPPSHTCSGCWAIWRPRSRPGTGGRHVSRHSQSASRPR